MSASKDDKDLRCTECLSLHTRTCDGRRPAETIVEGVTIPAHACRARFCDEHGVALGDRDLCFVCFTLPENA